MVNPSRNHHFGSPSFYGIMDYLTDYSAPHFFQTAESTSYCGLSISESDFSDGLSFKRPSEQKATIMNPFSSLGLGSELVSALTDQGYENPTPIQAVAIPKALAGHDLLAAAQTGTGKTAAFMLPSLERLKRYATSSTSPAMHPVRMLVLTPTRELADQIDQNVQAYIKNLPLRHTVLFGGVNMDKQTADLRTGCEIVVATVGRLLDHVKQKKHQFKQS